MLDAQLDCVEFSGLQLNQVCLGMCTGTLSPLTWSVATFVAASENDQHCPLEAVPGRFL